MDVTTIDLEGVAREVRALAGAGSPSEVFRHLLEGSRLACPRAAIFLARHGQVKGWGSIGYEDEIAARQRSYAMPLDAGWLGELAAGDSEGLHLRQLPGLDPDFGQPPPAEAVGLRVAVKQRAIALVVGERSAGDEPWCPAVLDLLVAAAEQRLELDLAQRKLAARAADAGPAPAAPVAEPRVPAATRPTPAPEHALAEAEPTAAPTELDAARRFARLVATDIRLYNEDAVHVGRRQRDLARRLATQLERGRELFLRRHGALGEPALEILLEAYVEVLAGGDAGLIPRSAFE